MSSSEEPEVSVTLSMDFYRHLQSEAERLGVALEWLVASLVADTFEEAGVDLTVKPAA